MEEISTKDIERTLKLLRSAFSRMHGERKKPSLRGHHFQMTSDGLSNIKAFVADLHMKEQGLDSVKSRKSNDFLLGSTQDIMSFEFDPDLVSKNMFFKYAPPIEYHDSLDDRTNIATLQLHKKKISQSINARDRRTKSQWCLKAVKSNLFGIHI